MLLSLLRLLFMVIPPPIEDVNLRIVALQEVVVVVALLDNLPTVNYVLKTDIMQINVLFSLLYQSPFISQCKFIASLSCSNSTPNWFVDSSTYTHMNSSP